MLGVLASVLCICTTGAVSNTRQINEVQTADVGLVFHITMTSTTACLGSKTTIEGELINVGNERVAIDRRMLWYKSHFGSSSLTPSGGEITSMETIGDPGPEAAGQDVYLVLDPGQSYKASSDFTLKKKFFRRPGRYTVRLTYGQFHEGSVHDVALFNGVVTSNQLTFDLAVCKTGRAK